MVVYYAKTEEGGEGEIRGETGCNPKTGGVPETGIARESCAGKCISKHENVHVMQQQSCCQSFANAYKRNPASLEANGKKYDTWADRNRPTSECTAYAFQQACYMGALSADLKKKDCKCYQEMLSEYKEVVRRKNANCAVADLYAEPCPVFD